MSLPESDLRQESDEKSRIIARRPSSFKYYKNPNYMPLGTPRHGPPRGPLRNQKGKTITICGETFRNRKAFVDRFYKIKNPRPKGYKLEGHEKDMVVGLLNLHPRVEQKIDGGTVHVGIGEHPDHPETKCFVVWRADGKVEDFSFIKIANEIFPSHGPKREATFVPGVVMIAWPISVRAKLHDLREFFSQFGPQPKFIDFKEMLKNESKECAIRFNTAVDTITVLSELADKKPKLFGITIEAKILSGPEEQQYWNNLARQVKAKYGKKENRRNPRNQHAQRYFDFGKRRRNTPELHQSPSERSHKRSRTPDSHRRSRSRTISDSRSYHSRARSHSPYRRRSRSR